VAVRTGLEAGCLEYERCDRFKLCYTPKRHSPSQPHLRTRTRPVPPGWPKTGPPSYLCPAATPEEHDWTPTRVHQALNGIGYLQLPALGGLKALYAPVDGRREGVGLCERRVAARLRGLFLRRYHPSAAVQLGYSKGHGISHLFERDKGISPV